jgi:predicted site-specific integrase-resolvase
MANYYAIGDAAKLIGVTVQTLRDWDKRGKLKPHHVAESGFRYYSQDQINQVIGIRTNSIQKHVVGYCRVSSSKQKDDLDRQIENMSMYLTAQGNPFEIISDIGSGINYNKKGLQELIRQITMNQVSKVVVLYKDRLLRFGFELIEYIASLHGCEIEVVDTTEKTEQQELVEDLVQIITVFSCRLQGKRANKTRKMIKELTEDEVQSDQSDVASE